MRNPTATVIIVGRILFDSLQSVARGACGAGGLTSTGLEPSGRDEGPRSRGLSCTWDKL